MELSLDPIRSANDLPISETVVVCEVADMGGEVKAILLAAGLGTRLRPLTDTIPKCLVPITGRPLLDFWIDQLADAGVREARVNSHAHAEQVRDYIARVNAEGRLRLAESHEPRLLGSAGTITANADLADGADAVIVVYADNFSDVDLRRMLAFHRGHGDPFTMLLFRAARPPSLRDRRAGRRGADHLVRREAEGASERPGQRGNLHRLG